MKTKSRILIIATCHLIVSHAGAQNLITNGSLSDPGAGGSYPWVGEATVNSGDTWRVPPSWNQLTGTPLLMGQGSADLWTSAGRWNGFNNQYGYLNPSPDGDVFVGGAAWADGNVGEGLWQHVSGLLIGQEYELTFWSTHVGDETHVGGPTNIPAIYLGPGFWNVYLDSTYLGSGATVSCQPRYLNYWSQTSINFTASATDFDLAFRAGTSDPANGAWIGIDGISLTAVSVPEPSSALLGGLGILFLLKRRR